MSKHKVIVAVVHRDRFYHPKLSISVEKRCSTPSAARKYIATYLMTLVGRRWSVRIPDFRIVDELGLKRLQAAAKASATLRRRRGAKKAAETRARNRTRQMTSPSYGPRMQAPDDV